MILLSGVARLSINLCFATPCAVPSFDLANIEISVNFTNYLLFVFGFMNSMVLSIDKFRQEKQLAIEDIFRQLHDLIA